MYRPEFSNNLIQQAACAKFAASCLLFCCLVAVSGSQALAQSESSPPATAERFVVLTNGNLLKGVVEFKTEEVILETAQGSRLVLDPERVAFACDSIEEAYWGKLARIKARDLEGQIELFHWCLRQDQYQYAQNQIDILQSSRIQATRLDYLNRQLKLAALETSHLDSDDQLPTLPVPAIGSRQQNTVASRSTFRPGKSLNDLDPVFKPLPAMNGQLAGDPSSEQGPVFKSIRSPLESQPSEVIQVGYAEPVDSESPISGPDSHRVLGEKNAPATLKELDDLCRAMPPGALGEFRRKIEKIFVTRCSDCHTSAADALPLMHAGKLQPTTRRMSQRNLHSTLQFVDRADPMASPLLSAATTAHGGGDAAMIKPGTIQYEVLRNWLVMISDDPGQILVPAEPARIDESEIRASGMKPINPTVEDSNDAAEKSSTVGESEIDPVGSDYTPKDDLDPEIFNRRFRKK